MKYYSIKLYAGLTILEEILWTTFKIRMRTYNMFVIIAQILNECNEIGWKS